MNDEQYEELIARLERIEAKQAESPWGFHFAMAMGVACVIFLLGESVYGFAWLAVYFFVKAYRWTIATIPPEPQDLMIMREGQDGEPDRPTPLRSIHEDGETK